MSYFTPKFLVDIANSDVRTVLLTGCGGGFDFVHSVCMIPELKRLNKQFIIGSYSFGNPEEIAAETVFSLRNNCVIAKKVYANSRCSSFYCPEVAICQFLDNEFPENQPHSIYAYYARAFSVVDLKQLHNYIIQQHSVNGILLFDGGSDSLMKGNEAGLGDPVEDTVSIAAVAELDENIVKLKVLISIGMGTDRFNDVSDCASLRAVSEINRLGGFLGSVSLEKDSAPFQFYKKCLDHIYFQQDFRSVLAGSIVAATEGFFADDEIPDLINSRVKKGSLYIWPIMAILWAFDVKVVASRSMIVEWIKNCETFSECNKEFENQRRLLGSRNETLEVEDLPRHKDYSYIGMIEKSDKISEKQKQHK